MSTSSLARYLTDPQRARGIQDGFYAVMVLGVTVALMLFLLGSADLLTSLSIIGILLCLSLVGSTLRFLSMTRTDADLQDAQTAMDQNLRVLQHRVGDHDLLLMKMVTQLETIETDVATIKTTQATQTKEYGDFMHGMKDRMMMLIQAVAKNKSNGAPAPTAARKKSPPRDFFAGITTTANDPALPPLAAADTAIDGDVHISPTLIREAINTAILNNRMDLYVQPLATLPQRHVFGYDITGRIRVDPGLYVSAKHYRGLATHAGQMVTLDRMILANLRSLAKTLRAPRLFLNLTLEGLVDAASVTHLTHLVLANPDLKDHLVVSFSGRDITRTTDGMLRVMDELRAIGIEFGVNDVPGTDLDLNLLARLKIKFLKLPSDHLIGPATTDEGAAILSRFLARLQARDMTLIVGGVESGQDVKTLLDFPVTVAQGKLFGGPDRPVAYPAKTRAA